LTSKYYDAVVLGTELGPLTAGALLARRGHRVLVVGQGGADDFYDCWGYRFTRRPFLLPSSEAPILQRVVEELGLGQLLQQVLESPEPRFQIVEKKARVDVRGRLEETADELCRELGMRVSHVSAALERAGGLDGEIGKLLANDLVIPPESFFERREFSRAEVQDPFRVAHGSDPVISVLGDERLADLVSIPARQESGMVSGIPPLALARQIGGWLFGCCGVRGGRDGLRRLLSERIVGQGGDLQPRRQVSEVVVEKGRVVGVRMAGREEVTGSRLVLTDLASGDMAPLVAPGAWTKRFRALTEDEPDTCRGYSINLGLDAEVVPRGMAGTVFLRCGPGLGPDLLRVERVPQPDEKRAALNVSCVVEDEMVASIESGALRDEMLDRMRWLVPFLDDYLRVIHSPFDGFGPLDLTGSAEGEPPPMPHREQVPLWLVRRPPRDGAIGIGNLPHRTGIRGLLLAGAQVVSGLSAEGELLAGWGAARVAGKLDPGRSRLVRSMRYRVET
jgi:phytoene dehydrogenase-like protein